MKNSTILVPCQFEKQDCLWSAIPLTTELRCLNCVESLLQSLEVRVVREESSTDAEGYSDTHNYPVTLT